MLKKKSVQHILYIENIFWNMSIQTEGKNAYTFYRRIRSCIFIQVYIFVYYIRKYTRMKNITR